MGSFDGGMSKRICKKSLICFFSVLEIPSIISTIFNILDPAQVMIMMAKMMMILMFKKFEYENWQNDNSFNIGGFKGGHVILLIFASNGRRSGLIRLEIPA